MKKTLGVIGFLVFIVIPISAWGEPPSIYVAGTHLNLGMSKSEVEKQIEAAGYRLKDSIITSKTGPPFDTPGTVSFNKDEKLRWVWKNWGTFHGDRAVSLGKAFFSALTKTDPYQTAAVIQAWTQREPDHTQYSIIIKLESERDIRFEVIEVKGSAPCVSVSESIGGTTPLAKP